MTGLRIQNPRTGEWLTWPTLDEAAAFLAQLTAQLDRYAGDDRGDAAPESLHTQGIRGGGSDPHTDTGLDLAAVRAAYRAYWATHEPTNRGGTDDQHRT